jgi:hypothetical protein
MRRSDLLPDEVKLICLVQQINFGRICDLIIRAGQPHFEPAPRVQRDHKFGGQNGARVEFTLEDFVLKKQQAEMFQTLRKMEDGTVTKLEIKGGLPFGMTVEGQA